jgi:hypothetical protein
MEHFQDVLTLPTSSDKAWPLVMNTSDANSSRGQQQNRREHPRVKVRVPLELRPEDSEVPIGGVTSDISLGGCYIEMMFTLARDTKLDITIKIDGMLLALGTVVTCDPNVGNGIKFTKMLPEDQEELRCYLEAAQDASESPT